MEGVVAINIKQQYYFEVSGSKSSQEKLFGHNLSMVKQIIEYRKALSVYQIDYTDFTNNTNINFFNLQSRQYYRIYSCISRSFRTKISAQKITLDLYTSRTQRPDLSNPRNQHNNCLKSVWKTDFIKPVRIVFEFRLFSAHSSSIHSYCVFGLQNRQFFLQLRFCLQCRTYDFIERSQQLSNLANAVVSRSLACYARSFEAIRCSFGLLNLLSNSTLR